MSMTLLEYSYYCSALSNQAYYMDRALKNFKSGHEQELWISLLFWAEAKHTADEINRNNDNMAFATAIGMAHGIERAFK